MCDSSCCGKCVSVDAESCGKCGNAAAESCGNDANPAIALKPGITVYSARQRVVVLEDKASLAPDECRELELLREWLGSVAPAIHGGDLEYPSAPMPAPAAERKGPCVYAAFGAVEPPKTLEARLDEQFGQFTIDTDSGCVASPAYPTDLVDKAAFMGVDVASPASPAYPTADEIQAGLDPKGAIGATKTPLHLLPPVAMNAAAWVHALGAEKYGPYNWRHANVCATTYVAAIMRHLNLYRDGIDLDDESGQSHLAHIVASCNILLDAAAAGTLVDDRYKLPEV